MNAERLLMFTICCFIQANTPLLATVEVLRETRGFKRWRTTVTLPDGTTAIEGTAFSAFQQSPPRT